MNEYTLKLLSEDMSTQH